MKYVDVVLPLPLPGTFTYAVPSEQEELRIGMRVVVPFGSRKLYTGIIVLIHTHKPEKYEAKEIVCLLDDKPVIRRPQYKFWEWISSYYMSTVGEVYQAAVPAGLKLESESSICINPDFEADGLLPEREQQMLDYLSDGKPVSIDVVARQAGIRYVMPLVKKLIEMGAVQISESVAEKFKPKMIQIIRIAPLYLEEKMLKKLFDELLKAPKQLQLLMHYIDQSRCLQLKHAAELPKKDLMNNAGASQAAFSAMVEKGIFEVFYRETDRLGTDDSPVEAMHKLNASQEKALQSVEKLFGEKQVVLLHGVTSSGKTELYIHLIEKVIADGKQVLYLVPEIALTTQLTTRLRRVFGNRLGVYHSKYSDNERVEIWNNVLNDKSYDIILGVRSSVFLPFRQLGLVIVDEEHEQSFKQHDPSPRYHARNAAIVLASMHGAKTLLGTATPAIESYYNAQTGKYGLVELHERHEDMQMPEIMVVDMKEAYRKKQHEGHFSDVLLQKIGSALKNSEQVILFQNRRGYAPFVECKACAYVPKCQHCDVSLTLHASFNTLNCHYCGYVEKLPPACPVCHTPGLSTRGFGTEKIEDDIKVIFPEARVQRMDTDTTRNRKSYEKLITDFEQGKTDILIGTQMVTKGLDFHKVSLVGILNADNLLNFPDFRAHERAYQLMAQVSGRAGRKHKRGLVVLQTSTPDHPVIGQVLHNDYGAMFRLQCDERQLFKYPPFYRLIRLTLKHKDVVVLNKASGLLAAELKKVFGARVLGPVIPPVSRIQNLYIREILMKIETTASADKARAIIQELTQHVLQQQAYRYVKIFHDVDPM